MNILFLTDGITPYVTGGMQQFANVLIKLLLKQGVSITLVHCGRKGETTFSEDLSSQFNSLEDEQLKTVFIPFLNKGKWPGHYIYENKIYSELAYQHFKDQLDNFDIIYAQGFTGWAFGKKPLKPKLLVNFHGFEMYQKAPNLKVKLEHFLLRPFVKSNCSRADYVYSFGGRITDILKNIGIPEAKILDQSNGIETRWLHEPKATSKPLQFIFIGRNERRKGIEELSEALIQLKQKGQFNFEFNFIGPIVPHHELEDKVSYLGEIKDQALIHQYLQNADVLVCPSHAEGMPTVILEAMANGLAIITSNVGASSKMINENGILLEAPSPTSIIKAINQINSADISTIDHMKQKSFNLVKDAFYGKKSLNG